MRNFNRIFPKAASSAKGFSLIEILIVITLIAIIGTFVGGRVLDYLYEGQAKAAKIQMNNLSDRLKEFYRNCYFYPSTEQGLDALISKPSVGRDCKKYKPGGYLEVESIPEDPWGGEYQYESDGKTFNIYSYGQDQTEGGEDKDADIYLKETKK
ncbi:MAG: type II secretion system major pseudopilin GspG [Halobacteriovoraceae bacterium]|nr:type II secretion system major pseudopilin GspG [Halobacteriovoraceae bacterium]